VRIITTHLGADFDAFGAAAGALLLWPRSRVVFPGSQEAAVRRFVAAEGVKLPEIRLRDLRRAKIEAAVVVDCAAWRRLGEVAGLIQAAGCPVEIVDHHPSPADPIADATVLTAEVASTCTVITGELRRRGLEPDALTASLLLMGLYEDTGGLTYVDTTGADLEAAAWLLSHGARLEWVRRYVLRPLEPGQLVLLNQIVEGAVEHKVGGVRVVVTVARPDEQVEEAAYVVHRYAEIFDLAVVIAILEAVPQLVVIARSTHPLLDAGRLLTPLGGGGHATAAAARVRGTSAVELAERLLAAIRRDLGAGWTAGALASPSLHSCPAEATVADAKERLLRLRINAMPVERDGALIGVVTRQTLDNALSHGLGERPVTMVMRPGVHEVRPDASMEEVERAFMEGQARFVVVPQPEGHGIITRMDLFRRLYDRQIATGEDVDRRVAGARRVARNVAHRLRASLATDLLRVLETAGEVATELGMRAFLVGGAVRDALLGRPLEDVDIVVEGNGLEVARRLAERCGGRCHPHEPFLTAAVRLPGDIALDVATARTEFYRSPAALPEVESSVLRQDLYRRDFTINAMAIDLTAARFGELLDFFGGQRDLEGRILRVLHSLSFLDDPTRAIRAARFATRLEFEIGAETRQLIRVAVQEGVFSRLSGERLRDELILLLEDEHPVEGLAELERLGVLASVFPTVRWSASLRRLLLDLESMLAWSELEEVYDEPHWPVFLAALATRAGEGGGKAMARRLAISGRVAVLFGEARSRTEQVLAAVADPAGRPSDVVAALERAPRALAIVAMAHAGDETRRLLRLALTSWVRLKPPVSGADLVAAGIAPGPAVGEAVRRTRGAVLDGVVDEASAFDYALALARGGGGAA
jgi:tRNA nucleotidyltransferase (CCA-adding enzyme)